VVWLCTGIWHGANWTFILWGVIYGALIITEKLTGLDKKMPPVIGHVYTLLAVDLLWVLFRADDISAAAGMLKVMFGIGGTGLWDDTASFYLMENWSVMLLAAVVSVPLITCLRRNEKVAAAFDGLRPLFALAVLLLSISFMVKGAYNPFIYFNF